MRIQSIIVILVAGSIIVLTACSPREEVSSPVFEPQEVIDLGTLVTEDLPERVWGKALLVANGFTRQNNFEVVNWEIELVGDRVSGSNAYYTLFNHGGPHVDAPKHISVGGGLDSYPIEVFSGPLKVFDVRHFPVGRTVPEEVFRDSVLPGDIVLIFTGYVPPATDDAFPETITLSPAAAEYLAGIPIRAFGTDAFSVVSLQDTTAVMAETETARAVPIHHSFLSRGIPIYEQLFNIDILLDRAETKTMYFVGVPLNIKGGDGMMVRPVVFVY